MTLDQLKALYAPYHNFREFDSGFENYNSSYSPPASLGPQTEVGKQAYDRGAECAMRWARYQREGKA
jgi:hypothetical protein